MIKILRTQLVYDDYGEPAELHVFANLESVHPEVLPPGVSAAEFTSAHCIVIPLAAITNRQEIYGLATEEEAVTAILREHHARLNRIDEWPRDERGFRKHPRQMSREERRRAFGAAREDVEVEPVAVPGEARAHLARLRERTIGR